MNVPARQKTNTPATRSTSGPPAVIDPAVRQEIDWIRNAIVEDGGKWRFLDRARVPRGGLLATIEGRGHAIEASLAHRDQNALAVALVDLLAVTKAPKGSELDAATIVEANTKALADLPTWAVVEACRRWAKAFWPAAAELRDLAVAVLEPIYRERGRLASVLMAVEAATPEAAKEPLSEATEAKLEALRADLGAGMAMDKAARRGAPAEDRFAPYRAHIATGFAAEPDKAPREAPA